MFFPCLQEKIKLGDCSFNRSIRKKHKDVDCLPEEQTKNKSDSMNVVGNEYIFWI